MKFGQGLLASLEDADVTGAIAAPTAAEETEQENTDIDNAITVADSAVEEKEDMFDELSSAADELEDVQETLEAMREALVSGESIPVWATSAVRGRAFSVVKRLDASALEAMPSTESAEELLPSLESAVGELKLRVDKHLTASTEGFMDALKNVWKTLTDASHRIYTRSMKLKKQLEEKDDGSFNEETAKTAADSLIQNNQKAVEAICEPNGGSFSFPKNIPAYLGEKQKATFDFLGKHQSAIESVIKDIKVVGDSSSEKQKAVEEAEKSKNSGFKGLGESSKINWAIFSRYFKSMTGKEPTKDNMSVFFSKTLEIPNTAVVPGGGTVSMSGQRAEVLSPDATFSPGDVAAGLTSLLADKKSLLSAVDTSIDLMNPSGAFSKAARKRQEKMLDELDDKVKTAAKEAGTLRSKGGVVMVGILAFMFWPAGVAVALHKQPWVRFIAKSAEETLSAVFKKWIEACKSINVIAASMA